MEDFEMQELLCGSVYHKNYVRTMMERVALMYNWCTDAKAIECTSSVEFCEQYGNYDAIIYCEPIEDTDLVCVFIMLPEELD